MLRARGVGLGQRKSHRIRGQVWQRGSGARGSWRSDATGIAFLGETMRKICFAILLVPALVWAEPKSADDWYKEGENQYNLGNFDKAVEAFKQGFSLETNESKKAAYLFNVAQSYRQANDCKNAQFFYKRFLSLKDSDTAKPLSAKTRKDVEERINELEACVQQATSISKKPPNNNLRPEGDST